jgi:hypothetical protein
MLFKIKHCIKRNCGFYVENIIRQVTVEFVRLLLCRLVGDFEFLCWEWTFSPSAQKVKKIIRLINFFPKSKPKFGSLDALRHLCNEFILPRSSLLRLFKQPARSTKKLLYHLSNLHHPIIPFSFSSVAQIHLSSPANQKATEKQISNLNLLH